jgi:uncharacterized protein YciI
MRELEAFELVILRRPPNAPTYDEETLDRLQAQHLAYRDELRAQGLLALNGPVIDQPDESLRGLSFFRTGSPEEALRLSEQDPLYLAGRLEYEVMTYWCPAGSIRLAGRAFTLDDAAD